MKMDCTLYCICVLLITVSVPLSLSSSAVVESDDYWHANLPYTSMPTPIKEVLPKTADNVTENIGSEWENSYEVVIQSYESKLNGDCHVDGNFIKSRFLLHKHLKIGMNVKVHLKSTGGISTRFPTAINNLPGLKSSELGDNLRFFNVKAGSKASDVMNMTIRMCESQNPLNGKYQYCATSLKGLVSYVNSTLGGLNTNTTKVVYLESSTDRLLDYKFVSINLLATETRLTVCHQLGFPYAVMYCHQPKATSAYAVLLHQKEDNTISQAYVICHFQTREWSSQYIGFKILRVQPGTSLCHFMQLHDLLWFTTTDY